MASPSDHTEDRGPAAMAIYWTQVGIAIIIVATRLYTRQRMKITGIDDWLMLITLVRLAILRE